jgi:hypothetical protein
MNNGFWLPVWKEMCVQSPCDKEFRQRDFSINVVNAGKDFKSSSERRKKNQIKMFAIGSVSKNVTVASKLFENVVKFKYLGTAVKR